MMHILVQNAVKQWLNKGIDSSNDCKYNLVEANYLSGKPLTQPSERISHHDNTNTHKRNYNINIQDMYAPELKLIICVIQT